MIRFPRPGLTLVILAAAPGLAFAAPDTGEGPQTVSCADWSTRYTSDPGTTFTDDFAPGPIELKIEDGRAIELVLPDLSAVFQPDLFPPAMNAANRRMSPDEGRLAWRRISPTLADSFIFTGLDTETPMLFWQRLRAADETLYETFIAASCTSS